MLVKTEGIVVSHLRFRDTSIIAKVFTRELGLKSYIVNGVRSNKSQGKIALYQPLTLLELVAYEKENAGINRISEAKLGYAFKAIPFDFIKSGVALFMAEVLSKSIYDNYQNEDLFDFLKETILLLDSDKAQISNFPLVFLWETSRYLGFSPEKASYFFEEIQENITKQIDWSPEMAALDVLISESFQCQEKIPSKIRRDLLDHMLILYSKNLEYVGEWKSVQVLRQLMR
ncbi:DNA recombination and repair protein RecO [Indibacter alkaliphilus LW1]|uniref:DNA repair protein RecO n=1 Tax=Indibacter alkaliphilus (strain CCUG 57479 / KCTC 22604 / LW1) TaxID=1189612 RepID=S2D4X3_INDAL|nr:DNA repair protein RecO [Indibacter alkaliphilus]EOZ92095.1 DNA recombination and repair protein RecO [Indibacter alkaliphilus LW1]